LQGGRPSQCASVAVVTLRQEVLKKMPIRFPSALAAFGCLSSLFFSASAYFGEQRWIFVKGQLRYKLNSAYCASVNAAQIEDGSDIIMWHCGTSSEFLWEVDGPFIRLKQNPKFCLSVREGKAKDGQDIILWSCDTTDEFKWHIDGDHVKYESDHRFWLSVSQDNPVDGQKIILWSGASSGFRWIYEPGSPHLKLKAKPSLCASSLHSKMDDGQALVLANCGPSEAKGQGWELVNNQLRSKSDPGKCLTVRQGQHRDGADIIVWDCADTAGYHWVVSGEHIRYRDVPDYCLAVDEDKRSASGSKLTLLHCDEPDAEDKEGLDLHHAKYGHDAQVNTFKWKIGADGGIRSVIDPRYCASVRGATVSDGSNIIMWHCGVSEKHSNLGTEFEWKVEGTYIKLKRDPSYCMSVREGKHGDGSDIILWSCDSNNAYRFDIQGDIIKYHADPQYHMSVRGGRIRDGADVILWTGYANPFGWIFEKSGKIQLKVDDKYCMSVRQGKIGDGSDVILWPCLVGDEFQWTVTGDHIVQYANPDYSLSVRQNQYKDGADIILWSCSDDDPSQKWSVIGDRIRYKAVQDYCVSVRGGLASDGSDIILWSCDEKLATDDEL